jgi:Flp pilus assembly pilin Flp
MKRRAEVLYRIGQSTVEYAVLLAVVAAALIAMQVYVRRGLQGRIRDLADQISPIQYEQDKISSSYTTSQQGTTVQQYDRGTSRTFQDGAGGSTPETSRRSGYEVVRPETQ